MNLCWLKFLNITEVFVFNFESILILAGQKSREAVVASSHHILSDFLLPTGFSQPIQLVGLFFPGIMEIIPVDNSGFAGRIRHQTT